MHLTQYSMHEKFSRLTGCCYYLEAFESLNIDLTSIPIRENSENWLNIIHFESLSFDWEISAL